MTFVLMTDSTADLDSFWAKEHNIDIVGLTVECDGKVYKTVGPDRLTSDALLAMMKSGSQPKTSQINVGQFEEIFDITQLITKLFYISPFLQSYQVPIKVLSWHVSWFWRTIQTL